MLLLAAITLLAAGLRFYHLGAYSLWADEGSSVAIATMPWHSMGAILWRRELNMSLYYLLLRGWMHLGSSEAFIRALSALGSVGTVVAVYWLGKRASGGRAAAGLFASAFLAINIWNIEYAQEARSYGLLLLVCALTTIFLLKAIESGRKRYWAAFAVAVVVGLYLQFFMLFVAFALICSLVLLPMRAIPRKRLMWTLAVCIAGFLPILIFYLEQDEDRMGWLPAFGRQVLQEFLISMGGYSQIAGYLLLTLVVVAAWKLWQTARSRGRGMELWRQALPFCWLVLPIAVVSLYSLHHRVFLPRYMQIVLPAAAVVLGATLVRLPRMIGIVAGAVLLVSMAWNIPGFYRHAPHEDWRSATEYVLSQAEPGDVLVIYIPQGRGAFEYYRRRMGGSIDRPKVVYPGGAEMDERGLNGIPFVFAAGTLKPEYKTVWIMLNNVHFSEAARGAAQQGLEMMNSRFRSYTEKDFYQMRVYRYQR